jgi:nitrogen-specific signal transduction histidine kinase/CheY-like chemotaxis protein
VVVFTDITEHRRLEQQLAQSQKMDAVGRLAGGVAHDLNNLLSPILGYAELLLGDLDADDARRSSVDRIRDAAVRCRDLVRQLLAFGRKQPLAVRTVDLNRVVMGLEPFLRRTIREDVRLETRLADGPLAFQADSGQIEQILMNLAINAKDAMPQGGTLTIGTAAVDLPEADGSLEGEVNAGRFVMLRVSDTGEGMDEDTRQRVFDPFFTTKELGHGTGLGLATVYGIVKQHGGHIRLCSEQGAGSTFTCYFPASEGEALTAPSESAQGRATPGHETIMVAEDNGMVRDLAVRILRAQGYSVLSAKDGGDCLRQLDDETGPLDLLLTDVVMPDINGKALFDEVSARSPRTKVLFMSGYTEDVIVHHGVLDEEVPFIQKPFTVDKLTAAVRAVLDS